MTIDPHRRAEERSIAYHRAIAERMRRDPNILAAAQARVRQWLSQAETRYFAKAWSEVFAGDPDSIAAFLTDPGEHACELRQSSPFAGALTPVERWRIWRETRQTSAR